MYDSEITAEELIKGLMDEIDASVEIPLSTYVRWLNSLERFLYRSIVKESQLEKVDLVPIGESVEGEDDDLDFQTLGDTIMSGEFEPIELVGYKFRDILSVYYHYADGGGYPDEFYPSGVELMKVAKGSRELVDNCYYDDGDGKLGICMDDVLAESGESAYLTISRVRYPEKKEIIEGGKIRTKGEGKDEDGNDIFVECNVMVPVEFIEMVCAKIRYEAYMLCEEPQVAANWLNVFNSQLEDFKTWHDMQKKTYGS